MVENQKQMTLREDEILLLDKYRDIKRHGWGKLEIFIQLTSTDKVSILLTGGKSSRFVEEKIILD